MKPLNLLIILLLCSMLVACNHKPSGKIDHTNRSAQIYPDYKNITIPYNLAPLNFRINEKSDRYAVEVTNSDGNYLQITSSSPNITFSKTKWRKLLQNSKNDKLTFKLFAKEGEKWVRFRNFTVAVSDKQIDKYLYYRLFNPGYVNWEDIQIIQRSTESFNEKIVVDNRAVGKNCVNCHCFSGSNHDSFLTHIRGAKGGTYIDRNGKLQRFNLKVKEMKNGAVYPRWHPSGRYVAFSSNKVKQRFHASNRQKIEVSDLESSLVLYDVHKNEIMPIEWSKSDSIMDTYPEWSPDGKYLYFCRAKQHDVEADYRSVRYNLYRAQFDPIKCAFSDAQLVFNADTIGKSISFPRVSPLGNQVVVTLHNYGCFPIWHKDADLYTINTESLEMKRLALNSHFTESYHTWSSNGDWMVFSSKRGDGLTARPYISYIDKNGKATKPFVLPQSNPNTYTKSILTYNIPELSNADFSYSPGALRRAANQDPIQPKWNPKN